MWLCMHITCSDDTDHTDQHWWHWPHWPALVTMTTLTSTNDTNQLITCTFLPLLPYFSKRIAHILLWLKEVCFVHGSEEDPPPPKKKRKWTGVASAEDSSRQYPRERSMWEGKNTWQDGELEPRGEQERTSYQVLMHPLLTPEGEWVRIKGANQAYAGLCNFHWYCNRTM